MLLLSRHVGQSLYIGEDIKITVIQHARGHLQLGITAPKEVCILREELRGKPDLKGQTGVKKTRILNEIEL